MPASRKAGDVHAEALEYLSEIRATINRASRFTAVPGRGTMAMGLIAVVGAWIATWRRDSTWFLDVWTGVAFVAFGVGLSAMVLKARRYGLPIRSGPGRRFAVGFSPPIVVGIVISWILFAGDVSDPYSFDTSLDRLLPGIWMMLYGVAVLNGGAFSIRPLPIMGCAFIAVGILTSLLPTVRLNLPGEVYVCDVLLAATFGGFHLGFGYVIHRRYGG